MKDTIIVIIVLACLWLASCSSPVAPAHICTTQPRAYALPDGTVSMEVDTYASPVPCPAVPIL